MHFSVISALAFCLLCLCSAPGAQAGCSHPVTVPAPPQGKMFVTLPTGEAGGIFVDVLREYGRRFGCEFNFITVPRARAELLLSTGQADMGMGMVKLPERDGWGDYVPLMASEWVLTTTMDDPPHNVPDLVERPGVSFNAVRGYNFGPEYQHILNALDRKGRLEYVADIHTIVRKMVAGRVDSTIMPSHAFAATMDELGLRGIFGKRLRYIRLAGLPPGVVGAYLSSKLPAADRAALENLLTHLRRDEEILVRMRRIFNADEMTSSYPLPVAMKNAR